VSTPTIFDLCEPRRDVLEGTITESDFAADLAQVLNGTAPPEYGDADKFFVYTHPTRGLKRLLESVFSRLSGNKNQVGSIFRLDTRYGGGKTHALIALSHLARTGIGIQRIDEFMNPELIFDSPIQIAAFDGENADVANGIRLDENTRAYTPWGELAYGLGGKAGFKLLSESDSKGVAPGSSVLRELIGDKPTLILIDELSVYLRKLRQASKGEASGQLTAFLTALFKAIESSPRACLVFTLAIDKEGKAADAYQSENQEISQAVADIYEELGSVSARKATLLDPTEEDETIHVLKRRLFNRIDSSKLDSVINAYQQVWHVKEAALPAHINPVDAAEALRESYPFHPEVLETLRSKMSTLMNFQRVRGMLRLLARTVADVWEQHPDDAHVIGLHHISLSNQGIRQEIMTRLGQSDFAPAVTYDVEGVSDSAKSIAMSIDEHNYKGMVPYALYAARTIFFHTLAFNEQKKGIDRRQLRYSLMGPTIDTSFVEDAAQRFVQESGYLDDRQDARLRFLTDININQLIRREQREIDADDLRAELNDRIRSIFGGTSSSFDLVPFPAGPNDVPDDPNAQKPILVLIGYDAESLGSGTVSIPDLVERIYLYKGASKEIRKNRNYVVFLVADQDRKSEMMDKMRRRLALASLRMPGRIGTLKPHQQQKLQELFQTSDLDVGVSVQQAYRHLFYPSRDRAQEASIDVSYSVIDTHNASANPGSGDKQVERLLRDLGVLRVPGDDPDSPSYIRDKTPLKNGVITVAQLRMEFRRDPSLPMLVGDDVFLTGIRNGISHGDFVYQKGDLYCGPGDPPASISIDEQSFVYTIQYAQDNAIWPRPKEEPGSTEYTSDDGTDEQKKPEIYDPEPPITVLSFVHQGTLKECLNLLWEHGRSKHESASVDSITLKVVEPSDSFRIFGLLGTISQAEKTVQLNGSYTTATGSELSFDFTGSHDDAKVLKEFAEAQFRAVADKDLDMTVSMRFIGGLNQTGEEPKRITDSLTRLGAGAAQVHLSAEFSA
jgi:hypothetical protein